MARVSDAPTKIAAGPPYKRNVRKTRASEKLIANFDLGIARLIRGARRTEKAKTTRNPRPNTVCGRFVRLITTHTAPARSIVPFARLWTCFLSISAGAYVSGNTEGVN